MLLKNSTLKDVTNKLISRQEFIEYKKLPEQLNQTPDKEITVQINKNLASKNMQKVKKAMQTIICLANQNYNMSFLFPHIVPLTDSTDPFLKLLTNIYLITYSQSNAAILLLSVNTLLKDLYDTDILIKQMAIATTGYFTDTAILSYFIQPLIKNSKHFSPEIRSSIAQVLQKYFFIHPETFYKNTSLGDILVQMCYDKEPIVRYNSLTTLLHIEPKYKVLPNHEIFHLLYMAHNLYFHRDNTSCIELISNTKYLKASILILLNFIYNRKETFELNEMKIVKETLTKFLCLSDTEISIITSEILLYLHLNDQTYLTEKSDTCNQDITTTKIINNTIYVLFSLSEKDQQIDLEILKVLHRTIKNIYVKNTNTKEFITETENTKDIKNKIPEGINISDYLLINIEDFYEIIKEKLEILSLLQNFKKHENLSKIFQANNILTNEILFLYKRNDLSLLCLEILISHCICLEEVFIYCLTTHPKESLNLLLPRFPFNQSFSVFIEKVLANFIRICNGMHYSTPTSTYTSIYTKFITNQSFIIKNVLFLYSNVKTHIKSDLETDTEIEEMIESYESIEDESIKHALVKYYVCMFIKGILDRNKIEEKLKFIGREYKRVNELCGTILKVLKEKNTLEGFKDWVEFTNTNYIDKDIIKETNNHNFKDKNMTNKNSTDKKEINMNTIRDYNEDIKKDAIRDTNKDNNEEMTSNINEFSHPNYLKREKIERFIICNPNKVSCKEVSTEETPVKESILEKLTNFKISSALEIKKRYKEYIPSEISTKNKSPSDKESSKEDIKSPDECQNSQITPTIDPNTSTPIKDKKHKDKFITVLNTPLVTSKLIIRNKVLYLLIEGVNEPFDISYYINSNTIESYRISTPQLLKVIQYSYEVLFQEILFTVTSKDSGVPVNYRYGIIPIEYLIIPHKVSIEYFTDKYNTLPYYSVLSYNNLSKYKKDFYFIDDNTFCFKVFKDEFYGKTHSNQVILKGSNKKLVKIFSK
ncbi:putative subunit beta of AP-4 vesicle coat complex [Hamiltosporidium tvaerminnensis]|uniref:Putative subunit beta of AP-4 vesicle coat complex n=1 Tax=Hamiltosporidium tvaerminnensis TaxID=1176355 RepID=A0A4Q9LSN8_9MICR|nr:putative subunit beta of AP-4 vesicle coat complex [Hamiltosporidium tvaerminnensis]